MSYRNSLRNIFLPLLLAIVLIVGILLGKMVNFSSEEAVNNPRSGAPIGSFSKLDEVLNALTMMYVDTIDKEKIVEKTIPEMLKQLDPHTVYIPKKELETVNSELDGKFSGIGVQFNIQSDTVVVVAVISNGPSQKLGVLPGDRIVMVDDSIFTGKKVTNNYVLSKLRGKQGTMVKLGVHRKGSPSIINFNIVRDEIPVNTVDIAYMLNSTVGYIRVDRFGQNTYQEFMTGLAKLRSQGMEELVIDLRGNSGGYLDVAINMCNEFLPKGALIVYTQGRTNERQNVYADGTGTMQNIKVAAIIDEYSASASEIVSGALQDNDRGVIVGHRSFGKGLVQQQMKLSDGSAMRVTIARYYTPSGRCIQKPYNEGVDAYYSDLSNRFKHGEAFSKDSITYKDTVQYKTVSGRIVYGGGGIMPDLFVPTDTTRLTPTYYSLWNKGNLYKFAFDLVDQNRAQYSSYKTVSELVTYLNKNQVFEKFIAQAVKQGAVVKEGELKLSRELLTTELNAIVCRNIFEEEGYFPLLNAIDPTVNKTIEELSKK